MIESLETKAKTCWSGFLCFTLWLGFFGSFILRHYTFGFILKYAHDKNLNDDICNIATAMFFVSTSVSPLIDQKLNLAAKWDVKKRSLFYGILIAAATLANIILDFITNRAAVYATIGLSRFIQGYGVGCILVIFRGELVDQYFRGNSKLSGFISSAIDITAIVAPPLSAYLYDLGSWTYTVPVYSILLLIPVACLQVVPFGRLYFRVFQPPNTTTKVEEVEPRVHLTWTQKAVLLVPDVVVFANNMVFCVILSAIPYRIMLRKPCSTTIANLSPSIMNIASFFTTLLLSYYEKRLKMIKVSIGSNAVYYVGAVLMFGSTTEYLEYRGVLEAGAILAGIGAAGTINVSVLTKFNFYKAWNCEASKMGTETTTYFNVAMSMSAIVGITIASISSSTQYEIEILIGLIVLFVITTKAMIIACII